MVWNFPLSSAGKVRSAPRPEGRIGWDGRFAGGIGAHRAAAFSAAGPGIDPGFPNVALRAPPPCAPLAAGGDHFGCERTVELGVPLGRDLGRLGGQVVEAGKDPLSRAVGAADLVPRPPGHRRLVAVSQLTAPPDAAVAVGGQHVRAQHAVFHGVPLS